MPKIAVYREDQGNGKIENEIFVENEVSCMINKIDFKAKNLINAGLLLLLSHAKSELVRVAGKRNYFCR